MVMDRRGKGVTHGRETPGPTTRQRHEWHPWGQLSDGRWITPDDLRDSDSPRTEAQFDLPPGCCIAVLIGIQGRNIRAVRAYTGAWIVTQDTSVGHKCFVISGSTYSVRLACAMISDFLTATPECVAENMRILRRIVGGEVAQPSAYAEGWGFMSFRSEQQGPKDPPPTTSKLGVPITAISSPEKGVHTWPSLASQAEVDQYVLHAVNQGEEQVMLHQKALEAEIKAMMTSSEDDSNHASADDAESVGPLESVEEDGDEAASLDLRESSFEFWAGRSHSRSDPTTVVEGKATGDASAVDGLREMFENEGWTVVSHKRKTAKGT